jgi:hypothetical protein
MWIPTRVVWLGIHERASLLKGHMAGGGKITRIKDQVTGKHDLRAENS